MSRDHLVPGRNARRARGRALRRLSAAGLAAFALGACASETADVSVRMTGDLRYDPASVQVPVGGTVSWENDGVHQHTVTAVDEEREPTGEFDSGRVVGTGTFSHTFEEAGSYRYMCTIHGGNMVGLVEVGT